MRKISIIIFLWLMAGRSQSQVPVNLMQGKASQLFSEGAYAEAIIIYDQLIKFDDSCSREYYFEKISECYKATGNLNMAIETFRKSIAFICRRYPEKDGRIYWPMLHSKQKQLGDLWFEMKRYDSALFYYKLIGLRWNGNLFSSTEIAYKQFQCYKLTKQWDSAFTIFTPFALDSTVWLLEDSSYMAMVDDYYNFLRSKHSTKKIRNSFIDGYNRVDHSYTIEKDTVNGNIEYTYNDRAIFRFLGQAFNLHGNSIMRFEPDRFDEKEFADQEKENYLRELRSSYLYKLIMLAK